METPLIVAAVLLFAAMAWLRRLPSTVKIIVVIDGDTVVAVDRKGVQRRIRVHGIDAPEKGQRGSSEATAELKRLVLDKWVRVRWRGRDKHRRFLARLRCEDGDVSALLVRAGLAFPAEQGLMRLRAWIPRLMRQGVWAHGARPHLSWRRRSRIVGWVMWRHERHQRRKAR